MYTVDKVVYAQCKGRSVSCKSEVYEVEKKFTSFPCRRNTLLWNQSLNVK